MILPSMSFSGHLRTLPKQRRSEAKVPRLGASGRAR
jgi:hypothetical protein